VSSRVFSPTRAWKVSPGPGRGLARSDGRGPLARVPSSTRAPDRYLHVRGIAAACGLLLVVAVFLCAWFVRPVPRASHGPVGTPPFVVPATGTDYYYPSDYFAGCPKWTWLTLCYSSHPRGRQTTARALLAADAAWIRAQHLGGFQRLWIMLDQGMRWDARQGYAGLTAAYLANLDDALATLHRHGIVVDLVVYGAAKGSRARYQFHAEALDGHHAAMRAGYLQALRDLVRHLARSPTAAATVAVLDLFNEAYLQLERFGLSDEVIHRWLQDEYDAAHGAAPGFNYTVSDTTRLLKDYRSWRTMYPADVYDIHVYDDTPWAHADLYARGKALGKPWFSGEAGCAPGHASCTYDGNATCVQPQTCALSVDRWFLEHLRADGARAVLIEERNTALSYPNGPESRTLTAVGRLVQRMSEAPVQRTGRAGDTVRGT
jgi:hypothetical protein